MEILKKIKGFLDPLIVPTIIICVCVAGIIVIKSKANGHESETEQAVEHALEDIIKYEGGHLLGK